VGCVEFVEDAVVRVPSWAETGGCPAEPAPPVGFKREPTPRSIDVRTDWKVELTEVREDSARSCRAPAEIGWVCDLPASAVLCGFELPVRANAFEAKGDTSSINRARADRRSLEL
jgi:hypothetical protein